MENKKCFYRICSLSRKTLVALFIMAIAISATSIAVSYVMYTGTINKRYSGLCENVAELTAQKINADMVDTYLSTLKSDSEYEASTRELREILNAFPDVYYIYAYQFREDGCHVVFDLDALTIRGLPLGESFPFDARFEKNVPAFLKGEQIDPIVTDDKYGWFLTVYQPLFNSAGKCVCYVGVGMAMNDVSGDRALFMSNVIAFTVLTAFLITILCVLYTKKKIVNPINRLSYAANEFAGGIDDDAKKYADAIYALNIKTGDEIENLYGSVSNMVSDVMQYINALNEKTAEVENKADIISKLQTNIIMSFANMIESRDNNTGHHVIRTMAYVKAIALELMRMNEFPNIMNEQYYDNLCRSAPLHDIGKVKISDIILNKPGRLTPDEFDEIKQHTLYGSDILKSSMEGIEGNNYLTIARDMALYHHEKWDGTGYPLGMAGNKIPLCARIMAVADVFDALTSKRSYKDPMSYDTAFSIIEKDAGTHFDVRIVAAFMRIRDEIIILAKGMDF
ncbi:MAG: HD domain-containing phosphohydrolase [Clostridia bacterium]